MFKDVKKIGVNDIKMLRSSIENIGENYKMLADALLTFFNPIQDGLNKKLCKNDSYAKELVTDTGKTINFGNCIISEANELLDCAPWRHWKDINAEINYSNLELEMTDKFHFIPVGTRISGIRRGGPNSEILTVEDYYISSVTFSMFESGPLYGIQKVTNDGDLLNIYSHGSFSESVLVFRNKEKIQKSIFAPYRSRIVLSEDEDENKKMIEERYKDAAYIFCSLILSSDEFILPGELVWIATNTREVQTILSLTIDKDWTISYKLKDRDDSYINSELAYKADILIRDMAVMTCEITI